MIRKLWVPTLALAAMSGMYFLTGCSHTDETAARDTLTQDVGIYPPGPSGVYHPKVGVPQFNVTTGDNVASSQDLNNLGADELTTLLDATNRFVVIERAQLPQLLKEQSLEGVVKSDEMARAAQVTGLDYIVLGKVTNLRVKKTNTGNNFGLGDIGGGSLGSIGGASVNNAKTEIKTECGVDIRLVNPTTGVLAWSSESDYNRTDSASSMGLEILGANAQSNADIDLSEDDKGKILRLALDDSIKKSLPKLDKFLSSAKNQTTIAPPSTQP